jgi:DNA-binding transcriptional regulator YiaG
MNEKREELNEQVEKLKQIRCEAGMNRTEFSSYIGIPLRTLEEWEAGRRKMPEYVLRLIAYYTKMERFLEKKGMRYEEDADGEN